MSNSGAVNEQQFSERVVAAALGLQLEEALSGSLAALATQHTDEPVVDANGEVIGTKQEAAQSIAYSERLLSQRNLKEVLCPALESVSGDLKDIAKAVSAVLLPLSLVPSAALPVTPLAFAAVAIVVFRAGISTLCAGVESSRSEGEKGDKE